MKNFSVFLVICFAGSLVYADLVQHWKLDDPKGEFVSAYGHTAMPITNEIAGGSQASIFAVATQQASVLCEQSGASSSTGTSITLNGQHDAIEVGNIAPGTNPFTIAFWFNTNGMQCFNDSFDHVLSSNRGQAGRWQVTLSGTKGQTEDITLDFYHDGGANFSLFDAIDAGQWYHLAMTRSDEIVDNYRIYLNGDEIAVLTDTAAFTCFQDVGGAIRFGNKLSNTGIGASRGLNGSFDDIRIYDNALTATEVAALVPEPCTIALLCVGGLFVIRKQRR